MIRTRVIVHLSCTAHRTILCQVTSHRQSKNDAKCASTENVKHTKGSITVRHSSCCVFCTRDPEKCACDSPRKDHRLAYPRRAYGSGWRAYVCSKAREQQKHAQGRPRDWTITPCPT